MITPVHSPQILHSAPNKCRRWERAMNYLFQIPITQRERSKEFHFELFHNSRQESPLLPETQLIILYFAEVERQKQQLRKWLTIRNGIIPSLDINWMKCFWKGRKYFYSFLPWWSCSCVRHWKPSKWICLKILCKVLKRV